MNRKHVTAAAAGLVMLVGASAGFGQIVPVSVQGSITARTRITVSSLPAGTVDSFSVLNDQAIGTNSTILPRYEGQSDARTLITQPLPEQIRFTGRAATNGSGIEWVNTYGETAQSTCTANFTVAGPSTLSLAGTIYEFVPQGFPGPYFARTSVRVFVNNVQVHSRIVNNENIFNPPSLPWTSGTLQPSDLVRVEVSTFSYSGYSRQPSMGSSPRPSETWFDITMTATGVTPACDSIDFNGNGVFPEDQDVVDFLNVLAGAPCPSAAPCDLDFNNNGVFPEDQDVVDFFNVLAGAAC